MSGDILAPNSDGWRLRYVDLARYGGYAESIEDLPTPEEIDAYRAEVTEPLVRRAATFQTARLLRAVAEVGDE